MCAVTWSDWHFSRLPWLLCGEYQRLEVDDRGKWSRDVLMILPNGDYGIGWNQDIFWRQSWQELFVDGIKRFERNEEPRVTRLLAWAIRLDQRMRTEQDGVKSGAILWAIPCPVSISIFGVAKAAAGKGSLRIRAWDAIFGSHWPPTDKP